MTGYRVLVAPKKQNIKQLLESNGITYRKGIAYYRLRREELIQDYKNVVVRRKKDGAIMDASAVRDVLGIPDSTAKFKLDADAVPDFDVFVQSTAPNRVVPEGDEIVYEVDDGVTARAAPGATAIDTVVAPSKVTGKRTADDTASTATADVKAPAAPPTKPAKAAKTSKADTPSTATSASAAAPAPDISTVDEQAEPAAAATASTTAPAAAAAPGGGPLPVEVLLSFDTTGSMYPCLTVVRAHLRQLITRLFTSVPGIRVAVIAHGDYDAAYLTKSIDFSVDATSLCKFVDSVENAPCSDYPEAYEYVLREAHTKFSWSPVAQKALVMIGDVMPHEKNDNPYKIDWREECAALRAKNIRVYAVQALDCQAATPFYATVAQLTGGQHLRLAQFATILDFILAICFREHSLDHVQQLETEIRAGGRMNRNLHALFDTLLGRAPSAAPAARADGLVPVAPSRFQVLTVDKEMQIRDFAQARGLLFKPGRGFYEFTKPEKIAASKEVVLVDKASGDMFTGPEAARLIGVTGGEAKIKPSVLDQWRVFVQSTSYNRKLVPGTGFLYEVDNSV